MKGSFLFFVVFLAFGTLEAHGQTTLGSLKLEFDVDRAELRKPVQKLQTIYEERLNQLLQKVTGAGELEKALAVKAEIEGFKEGKSSPAIGFPELRQLQATYASALTQRTTAMNQNLGPVVQRYRAKLEELQKALTTANQLDQAVEVKTVIDEIDKTLISRPLSVKPDRNALVEIDAAFLPFQKDVVAFSDKGYKWIEVPRRFEGTEFSLGKGGMNQTLKFKVAKGGIVTILAETTDMERLSKDGWKEVAQADREAQKTFRTSIMEKELAPGEYSIISLDFLGVRLLRPVTTTE